METQREIIDRLYETYDNKEYCTELICEAMNIWAEQVVKNLNIPAVINQGLEHIPVFKIDTTYTGINKCVKCGKIL